jgi:hypothetical protein
VDYREATADDAEAIAGLHAGPFPGGGHAYTFRYAWPDLSELAGNAR